MQGFKILKLQSKKNLTRRQIYGRFTLNKMLCHYEGDERNLEVSQHLFMHCKRLKNVQMFGYMSIKKVFSFKNSGSSHGFLLLM